MFTRFKKHSRPFTKLMATLTTATAAMLLFAGIASAHVTVTPAVSKPGAWETYTMKVPVEKEVATNKVALKVPDNVDFKQYEPVPGWTVAIDRNAAGKVDTVTWTSEGDGIEAGQYQRFSFVAVNPSGDADVTWNAFQYYADGSIVEWTGGEGSQRPHSITKVTADDTAVADTGHSHGNADGHHTEGDLSGGTTGSADNNEASNDTAATDSSTGSTAPEIAEEQAGTPAQTDASTGQTASGTETAASPMNTSTTVISIAALVISLAALTLAIRNRQRR